jgi:hypothetical protein
MTTKETPMETTTAKNPGEQVLVDAGITSPTAWRAFKAEAHYVMNCTGGRYSDAMRTAVSHGLNDLTSPVAQGIVAEWAAQDINLPGTPERDLNAGWGL